MDLTPREIGRLHIYVASGLARKRQGRSLKLEHPEAVALLCEAIKAAQPRAVHAPAPDRRKV